MLETLFALYVVVAAIWIAASFIVAILMATVEDSPEQTKWAFQTLLKGFVWPYYLLVPGSIALFKALVKTFRYGITGRRT